MKSYEVWEKYVGQVTASEFVGDLSVSEALERFASSWPWEEPLTQEIWNAIVDYLIEHIGEE